MGDTRKNLRTTCFHPACALVLLFNLRSCRGGSMQTFCLSTLDLHFLKYSAETATIKNLGIGGGWDSAN